MDRKKLCRAIADCYNGEFVNSRKFFAENPYTPDLEKALYNLARIGYIVVDEGDTRIVEIDTGLFFERLLKEAQ